MKNILRINLKREGKLERRNEDDRNGWRKYKEKENNEEECI